MLRLAAGRGAFRSLLLLLLLLLRDHRSERFRGAEEEEEEQEEEQEVEESELIKQFSHSVYARRVERGRYRVGETRNGQPDRRAHRIPNHGRLRQRK